MKIKSLKLPTSKCCYCYISKDLKREIQKHQKKIKEEHNKKYGSKAGSVSFSFASKDILGRLKKKWY